MSEMHIEYVAVSEVLKWPRNPRKHDPDAMDASIKRFGFCDPVTLDENTGHLVEGHGRIEALERRRRSGALPPDRVKTRADGEWLVPIVRGVAFKDELEAEAYVVAHNRIGEGMWDNAALAEVLLSARERSLEGLGFDDSEEVDKIIAEAMQKPIVEDEVPELPTEAVCKIGEIWLLGDHKLLCGSCENLGKIVEPKQGKLLITDPPYGVSYADKNRFLNAVSRGNRIQEPILDDHHTAKEMSALWLTWFSAVRPLLADGACYYVTGPQGGDLLLLLLLALRDSNFPLRHMLVWAKQQFVLGRCDYHYQHEPIIYGWVEGAGHKQVSDRGESSLWQIDKPHKSDLHPTMKPVELYARAMRNSSARGDLVLEPFSGSGTAFIAAQQLERKVAGAELDPRYCDVAIERWQRITGGKARRA